MSWLFKIEGTMVYPNAETLLIPPFKEIWERDTSKDKWQAMKEFAYMEFMTSQLKSNPYKGYSEKVKEAKILEDIIKDDTWEADDLVNSGIEKILDIQTNGSPSYRSYTIAMEAKNKSEKWLNNFDPDERVANGGLVLKPKDISNALLDYGKVAAEMESLKKKVEEELFETVKTRANKVISPFANPNSI